MATKEQVEMRFRETLKRARVDRKWSQSDVSNLLKDKGIDVPPTGVAKIEAGTRSVGMAEAVAFAELLDVSLDTLLGRSIRSEADMLYTVHAVVDTAQNASVQLSGITRQLRDRIADLATIDRFGQRDLFASALQRALDAVAEANEALYPVWATPQARAITEGQRRLDINLDRGKRGKR